MNLSFSTIWEVYSLPTVVSALHLDFSGASPWAACLGMAKALPTLLEIKHLNESLKDAASLYCQLICMMTVTVFFGIS